MSSEPDIDKLLMRSAELEKEMCELFNLPFPAGCRRTLAARVMCNVVYEHARSIKILMAAGSHTSAFGLYRLQYEALVRAFWLMFAASDNWVSTLMTDVSPESMEKSNNLPSASNMLTALEGKAPENAVIALRDFKAQVWKLLCSFVHGGFHALHRQGGGYPPILVAQVLRGSNGLCLMGGNLLVIQALDMSLKGRIRGIEERFLDCLPDPKPPAEAQE
jgi:hypothetical protein